MKRVNTRIQLMLSSCLKQVDNKEKDHQALPITDANCHKLTDHEDQSNATDEQHVESLFSGVGCLENSLNCHESIAEKSIEPPPYSPLTPRPLSNFNAPLYQKQCISPSNDECLISPEAHIQSHKTIADKSIVHSLSSQLVPQPIQSTPLDPLSSPLRPMSPETTKIYNMLIEGISENNFESPETIEENRPTASSASSNRTEIMFNSDDSVQDPDFVTNDLNGSDTSSAVSVSLLTTEAEVYGSPTDTNEFPSSSHSNHTLQVNSSEATRSSQGRPSKGRKRKYGELSREDRKKRKYQNLSYVNSRKQNIDPKPFLDYDCNCPRKCRDKISSDNRLTEFQKFYALGTYEAQNMFIAACVKELPVKRSYASANTGTSKKKTFTREYYLKDVLVCKKMFVNTLKTSSKRVNTSLCKKRDNCIKDTRGKQAGHNKVDSESEALIISVIQKLPTYVSHYRRAECNDAKFLRPDMTFQKIYELYCDEARSTGQKVLSFSKVKHVFLTKFNLRTKPLKKDTCNKCDYYATKKRQGTEEEKTLLENAHSKHLETAKCLKDQLKSDMQLAREDPYTETLTFDLEKTLPLPRIPTNVVFYKRQLWVYNFGIHSGSNDQAHCNVWVEGEAGRGSQEVGSCLIKHIMERCDGQVKNLILWSDSCGGQNRNIKLTLMIKALLGDHPTLQTVRLRFLESGHSFLPNDSDFGRIECALKLQQRLYTPEDYMRIMQSCKKNKPMQVHRMRKEDFLSSTNLEKKITNRKKATNGSKVSWLNTKEILIKKEEQFSIFMRCNLNDEYVEVNLKKNVRGNTSPLTIQQMDLLWPNGKSIPEAKLNDLKSLLHLIPEDAQDFYKKLTGDSTIQDDIEGFSGQVDFQVEVDDVD